MRRLTPAPAGHRPFRANACFRRSGRDRCPHVAVRLQIWAIRRVAEASPAALHRLEAALHLNRGLPDQYWIWFSGLFTGHLGHSLVNGQPVWGYVQPRLINSAVLMLITGAIGAGIGVVLGAVAVLRKDGWFDHITAVAALTVTSLPEFVVAIGLVVLFSTVVMHLLPTVSLLPPGTYAWNSPR